MRHSDVVFLITKETTYDGLGNPTTEETERMIYVNEMSVGMNEFYEAGNSGLKPERQFETYSYEYNGESRLKHNDKEYKIIRSSAKGDKLQLICGQVVGT